LEDGIGTAVYKQALWTSVHQGKAPSFAGSEPPCPERASKATSQKTGKRCHGVPGFGEVAMLARVGKLRMPLSGQSGPSGTAGLTRQPVRLRRSGHP